MASSLSNLDNNLSKRIHKLNVITKIMIKTVKIAELNINIATVSLNTQTLDII